MIDGKVLHRYTEELRKRGVSAETCVSSLMMVREERDTDDATDEEIVETIDIVLDRLTGFCNPQYSLADS